MMRHTRALSVLLAAAIPLIAAAPRASAQELRRFSKSQIFFEENATAGDLGVHFLVDGEAWERAIVFRPDGEIFVDVEVRGSSRVTGLTELFTESSEPPYTKVPRAQFLARFPTGQYNFLGRSVEGKLMVGTGTLTHAIPAPPKVLAPAVDSEVDATQSLVIRWDLVPNPAGSTIEAYQIIVEKTEEGERLRVFTIDLKKTDTSVTLPLGFLEPGKGYNIEVTAIEAGGNRTFVEVPFDTKE